MRRFIYEGVPKAIGPYSHAVLSNGNLYISGQLGVDPKTNQLVEGIESQTRQALENVLTVLEKSDMDVSNLAKVTIFVTDMGVFQTVNKIYAQYVEGHYPARAVIGVNELPMGALVEVEAIASKI